MLTYIMLSIMLSIMMSIMLRGIKPSGIIPNVGIIRVIIHIVNMLLNHEKLYFLLKFDA
jgi:hypothetical protein